MARQAALETDEQQGMPRDSWDRVWSLGSLVTAQGAPLKVRPAFDMEANRSLGSAGSTLLHDGVEISVKLGIQRADPHEGEERAV